jgi:hypothetical protein
MSRTDSTTDRYEVPSSFLKMKLFGFYENQYKEKQGQ